MDNKITTTQGPLLEYINTKADLMAARDSLPRYRDGAGSDRKNRLFAELQYAALMDNQEVSRQALMVIVGELEERMVAGPYGAMTWPEIRTAIRRGASGMYGDWYRINVRTALAWLDGFIAENRANYRESEDRARRERLASMGEYYLEKVRRHAEITLRRRETGDKCDSDKYGEVL